MEQQYQDEYWDIFRTGVQNLPETEQRKIALEFCQLIKSDLDELGKKVLKVIQDMHLGKASTRRSKLWQKRLQLNRPKDHPPSLYSPLIWALMENTSSYPTWYSVSIAGANIVDLNKATYRELTMIIKLHLSVV